MNGAPAYTLHHPKWYRRRVSVWWWLKQGSFVLFVLRELTSVFVAYASLLLLGLVRSLAAGPGAYARFLAHLANPWILALDLVALVFVLFHAVSWFQLAPKALVLRPGGRRLPDAVVAGLNFAAWAFFSAGVAFLLLRS